LIAKGETEKAVKIMKKIARINGRSVSDEVYKSFEVWVVEDAAVGKTSGCCSGVLDSNPCPGQTYD
jgi:hypothetical protein